MYIFKNALRSISRSKVRSVLISIIILVVAVSTCVALSIREAASTAKEALLDELEITASISFDRSSMMKDMKQGSPDQPNKESFDKDSFKQQMAGFNEGLELDELEGYAKNENVKSFYYTLSTSANGSDSFEAIDTTGSTDSNADNTFENPENAGNMGNDFGQMKGNFSQMFGSQGDFTIIGYSSDEAMTDFLSGTSTITDGAVFEEGTSSYDCIISDELATYNNVSLGDTITLTNPNDETEQIKLTVVGTYTGNTSSSGEMMGFSASQDSANKILMSYNALKAITTASSDSSGDNALASQVNATYTFADVARYESFCDEVYDMGLSEEYSVSSQDYNAYEQSLQPIENLSTYALYFLIVVLIIGAIILVVINIFNIRERKYEIGVMAAIGMKKGKIALQFISEMLVITLVTVIIGTGIGACISVPVGDALLKSQTESVQQQQSQTAQGFGRDFMQGGDMPNGDMPNNNGNVMDIPDDNARGGIMNSQLVTDITASTNLTVFAQLMGIAILLSLLASGVSVIFVLRYDPMKILSNRD